MQTSHQCIDLLDFLDSPAPTLGAYAFAKSVQSDPMYALISRAIDDIAGGVDECELPKITGIVDRIMANKPRLCDLHQMPTTLQ